MKKLSAINFIANDILLKRYNKIILIFSILTLLVFLPLGYGLVISFGEWSGYSDRRYRLNGSSDQALKNADSAVIEIYCARSARWRGVASVHCWLAMKRQNEREFTRYEVIGWKANNGDPTVVKTIGKSDDYWYGYRPEKLFQLTGENLETVISSVESEISNYPFAKEYKAWPGPNSNTFIAYLAKKIPAISIDLPPTAIGKDYVEGFQITESPSNKGYQINMNGLFGILLSREEGLEINIASAVYGVDIKPLGIKLPAVGRLGLDN